jgi:hypothetical protein
MTHLLCNIICCVQLEILFTTKDKFSKSQKLQCLKSLFHHDAIRRLRETSFIYSQKMIYFEVRTSARHIHYGNGTREASFFYSLPVLAVR